MERNHLLCLRNHFRKLFPKILFRQKSSACDELCLFFLCTNSRTKQCSLLMDQIYRNSLSFQTLKKLLRLPETLDQRKFFPCLFFLLPDLKTAKQIFKFQSAAQLQCLFCIKIFNFCRLFFQCKRHLKIDRCQYLTHLCQIIMFPQ